MHYTAEWNCCWIFMLKLWATRMVLIYPWLWDMDKILQHGKPSATNYPMFITLNGFCKHPHFGFSPAFFSQSSQFLHDPPSNAFSKYFCLGPTMGSESINLDVVWWCDNQTQAYKWGTFSSHPSAVPAVKSFLLLHTFNSLCIHVSILMFTDSRFVKDN